MDQLIAALRNGGMVAVTDHQDREDEADIIMAAEQITPKAMAFFIRHTSGIVCVPLTQERANHFTLELLYTDNPSHFNTPFTMPVDLKSATRGGVSAEERAATVRALVDMNTPPEEFGRPGHVFPLIAHPDGLAGRAGHTEAAIDLLRMAELQPVAVIGELMNEDGSMMRGQQLEAFCTTHQIPLTSIEELIRAQQESVA